jgi:hypothetical protein
MISQMLKKHKLDLWNLIQKNNSTKQKIKSIDGTWKQIHQILDKEFKLLTGNQR